MKVVLCMVTSLNGIIARDNNEKIFYRRITGKHFTAQLEGEWELFYKEECGTRTEALKREKQSKSYRGREFLRQFIPL